MGIAAVIVIKMSEQVGDQKLELINTRLSEIESDCNIEKCTSLESDQTVIEIDGTFKKMNEVDGFWYWVNTSFTYCGSGYERGPGLHFINIAEIVERVLPTAEVYYGSEGVTDFINVIEVFSDKLRDELRLIEQQKSQK